MNFKKNGPTSFNLELLNMEKASVVSNDIDAPSQKDEGVIFETPDYISERVNSNEYLGNG